MKTFAEREKQVFSFMEAVSKSSKGERQIHGFKFETFVKEKFNILPCPEGHYTYKWDGILNGYPVSIKTEKNTSDVEMASFVRNAINTDSFYLIVGFWEDSKDNIVTIETLFIDGAEWHQLFDVILRLECKSGFCVRRCFPSFVLEYCRLHQFQLPLPVLLLLQLRA